MHRSARKAEYSCACAGASSCWLVLEKLSAAPAIGSARETPSIGVGTAILRVCFRSVEATSPFVEFFPQRVDPPSMIRSTETLFFGHYLDGSDVCRTEPMS